MAMTQYDGNVEIITNIGTTPNERGLTTEQFKAKFDEGLKTFVEWFNDTHKTEFDALAADTTKMPLTGGTFTGIVTANSNTSYTTKQVRNIILSTSDAVLASMDNGDLWVKYE